MEENLSVKTWWGLGLATLLFGLFGFFIHQGCDLTPVWGFAFAGGALFCGILIDPEDFRPLIGFWRTP